MEISSYTSNIQPYGSKNGTKVASENESTRSISVPRETKRSDKLSEQVSEQVKERQAESIEAAKKLAKDREHVSEEQRAKMMEQMQEFISSINKGLSFRVDQESGRDVVTIYEADSGDVIRQIPEEDMLEVLRRLARENDHKTGLFMTKV